METVTISDTAPAWLAAWMREQGIDLWGTADLRGFDTPSDETGERLPRAVAWGVPLNPAVMAGILDGPTQAYADEYAAVNRRINDQATLLAAELRSRGVRARALAASVRSDPEGIRGEFPHKTAATRAGLGWIGRNCQLVTRRFGPWLRLGTVFTDLEMPCGPAIESSGCGQCRRCVDACPAKAITGTLWRPGLPREELLDPWLCDQWKKEHYFQYHKGHNCGICAAVCPRGLATAPRRQR